MAALRLSVAPGVCDADNRNRVSLVFETPGMFSEGYAISILSDFGAMLSLATTAQAGDCMCRMDNCEPTNTVLCTYGTDVATGGPKTCGRATQNEPMILAGVPLIGPIGPGLERPV